MRWRIDNDFFLGKIKFNFIAVFQLLRRVVSIWEDIEWYIWANERIAQSLLNHYDSGVTSSKI